MNDVQKILEFLDHSDDWFFDKENISSLLKITRKLLDTCSDHANEDVLSCIRQVVGTYINDAIPNDNETTLYYVIKMSQDAACYQALKDSFRPIIKSAGGVPDPVPR